MRILFILILKAYLISIMAPAQSWVQCPLNGHSYGLTYSAGTWLEMEDLAIKTGGHLATIRNPQENDWILNTFAKTEMFYFGFTDEKTEGIWLWSSGENTVYTNWNSGEPNNYQNVEHYGEMFPLNIWCAGTWNDGGLYKRRGLIEKISSTYSCFGAGCKGTNGVPEILPLSVPKIGKTYSVVLINIPLNMPGFMTPAAKSVAKSGSLVLPLELTQFGMTGCRLYVSMESGFSIVHPSNLGAQIWGLAVPNDPTLVGAAFFNQAFYLDHAANPAGLVVSNAGVGVIGI